MRFAREPFIEEYSCGDVGLLLNPLMTSVCAYPYAQSGIVTTVHGDGSLPPSWGREYQDILAGCTHTVYLDEPLE